MSKGTVNSTGSYAKWWVLLSILLIAAIIAGGIMFGLRQWGGNNAIEITPPPSTASTLEIYLSGSVANEGIYTFNDDSSIRDILQSSGGVTGNADLDSVNIYVPAGENSAAQPQKININTAEAWLLEALPGIGPALAQKIIAYRENEGPFRNIYELTEVNGIGTVIFEDISARICVLD